MKNKKGRTNILLWIVLSAVIFSFIVLLSIVLTSTQKSTKYLSAVNARISILENFIEKPSMIILLEERILQNSKLTNNDIIHVDNLWQRSGDEFVPAKNILENNVSKILQEFQSERFEFIEIFITDVRGLNVGMTNITSDYFQADEDWWKKAANIGTYFGDIEFDESARGWGVPLYIQIHSQSGDLIGIVKAVVSIDNLMRRDISY